jgi:lipopolysaccharide transport system permease protein
MTNAILPATSTDAANDTAATGRATAPSFTTVITPHRGWFDWRLSELWRYRDLITLFVWRDFVSVYKQTILGPAWHIIKPLFTTLIFTLVFGKIAGLSTDGAPQFLFYMVGNIAWTYFSATLDNTSKTFVSNSSLLGKVYFHRLVIPISLIFSNLVAFGIQFGILLVAMAYYALSGEPVHLTWWGLLTPVLLLYLAGYSLGGGIIICAMTTRYRDLSYLVTFGIQSLMFVTPVIFPLTPVFEGFRLALLGVGTVTLGDLLISGVIMLLVLAGGMMLFTRVERTFMDTV